MEGFIPVYLILIGTMRLAEAAICNPNPCKNDGICQPCEGGYNWGYCCSCGSLFRGAQCQWDNDECLNGTRTPCLNNGSCVKLSDGRFCICPGTTKVTIKYGGHYCDIENPCSSCPATTAYCQPAPYSSSGRLCLDALHQVIG